MPTLCWQAFGSRGYTYIVNRDCRALFVPKEADSRFKAYNIVNALADEEFIHGGTATDLRTSVKNQRPAVLEFSSGGADYFVSCHSVGSELKEAMLGDGSFDTIAADMDELHRKALAEQSSVTPLATVKKDLTHPQTIQVMADLLYEFGNQAGADVAVVSDGTFIGNVANTTGVSGRLFAGDIYSETYSINIPGNANKNVMRLTLTGRELFALLEGGRSVTANGETAVFDYYWSGLDAQMKDGRIVSAVLKNGDAVKEGGTYQVLICAGDYDTAAYTHYQDTNVSVANAYLDIMRGKNITAPSKLCR